jgi:galactokinase
MNEPTTLQRLIARTRSDLSYAIDLNKPYAAAAAPAILDVMGGIAELMGSATSKLALNRQAAALVQPRDDGEVQVFSFNLFDEHRPFTLRMPLDQLRSIDVAQLRTELTDPARGWAADALAAIRLDQRLPGLNVIMLSDIPAHVGVGSAAAMQVAMAKALADLILPGAMTPDETATLAWAAGRTILGREGFRSTRLAAAGGETLHVPEGFELSAIVGVTHSKDLAVRVRRHLNASMLAVLIITYRMGEMGRAAGRELLAGPLEGKLMRVDPDDYKKFFRRYLPGKITYKASLDYPGMDRTSFEPDVEYATLGAADHHVLETRRVRQFQQFMAEARQLDLSNLKRHTLMDKAGHLMYASHHSMMNDAQLGDDRCDWIVQQVRALEKSGLYGARMTGVGCGGAVAVLHEAAPRPREVVREIARRAAVQFEIPMDVLTPPDAA